MGYSKYYLFLALKILLIFLLNVASTFHALKNFYNIYLHYFCLSFSLTFIIRYIHPLKHFCILMTGLISICFFRISAISCQNYAIYSYSVAFLLNFFLLWNISDTFVTGSKGCIQLLLTMID